MSFTVQHAIANVSSGMVPSLLIVVVWVVVWVVKAFVPFGPDAVVTYTTVLAVPVLHRTDGT